MTTLAAHDLDPNQLDLLQLVADNDTPLGRLHRDDFEQACRAVADVDGWVNPNLVSAWLHARWGEINPRAYSAAWAGACSKSGFMDTHRDIQVPIDGKHSRGNGGKTLPMRRLRNP
jgi:glycine/D-amino acid oxidase-like deaminating enzyme